MAKKLGDKILNKITGRKMETIDVSLDEIVEMLDKYFIQPAPKEEHKIILKTIKGSWLTYKTLESKDENYELSVFTHRHTGLFNLKDHNYMWIWDKSADKYYEYRAYFWGKLKKSVREKLNLEGRK